MTFLWGTAVAAHQVEGENVHSDWWDYEQRGLLPHKSGRACDFWNRWRGDFDLIASLGHNAFRFSVEWARVEPTPGRVDESALDRYVEMARDLRSRGIEPVVTLHHFVNPRWFAEAGAFEKKENVELFVRYVGRVAAGLAQHVRYWVTINEPMVYAYQAYARGLWPPLKSDLGLALKVMGNLLQAHAGAYHLIHRCRPDAMVSIAKHIRVIQPYRPRHTGDRLAAWLQDYASNEAILRAFATGRFLGRSIPGLRGSWDYAGLNYYTRGRVRFAFDPGNGFAADVPPEGELNALGWEVYPDGLYQAIRRLGSHGKPVIITENGICARDDDDPQRVRYLHSHLDAVERARRDGVRVEGYLYWTLYDNYEWAEGFEPRFGLVEMDFETLERRPRPSAREFAGLRGMFAEV